jgi:hypothetical protein
LNSLEVEADPGLGLMRALNDSAYPPPE